MILDRHHLVLYAVVAGGLLAVSYLYADWRGQVADQRVQAANTVLAEVRQSNALLAQQIQQQAAAFAAERAQRDAQNVTLLAVITRRDAELATRKQQDAVLTLPQVGARWAQLLTLAPGELTPTADGRLGATLDASRRTVTALEDVPVLAANLADTSTQLANERKNVAGLDAQVNEQRRLIVGKDDELVKAGRACDARVTQVKAQAVKSRRRWFIAGAVVGFIGRTLVGR